MLFRFYIDIDILCILKTCAISPPNGYPGQVNLIDWVSNWIELPRTSCAKSSHVKGIGAFQHQNTETWIYGFTMNYDETQWNIVLKLMICCKLWIFSKTQLHHRNVAKRNLRAQPENMEWESLQVNNRNKLLGLRPYFNPYRIMMQKAQQILKNKEQIEYKKKTYQKNTSK